MSDAVFMRRALALASRARGTTSPNPTVGCVLVRDGEVIAEGVTQKPGRDHAEVDALRKLGFSATGATAYVTLEPCNHHGRTGPCSEALIAAGVTRVVYALRDPNARVDGHGEERLRAAGVAVEGGLLAAESAEKLRAWVKYITTGRPWVTLKGAVSLDGRIAASSGESKWITGEPARKEAHRLRAAHDAILVGAGTVLADDPSLTVRGVKGRDPRRVILDGKLRISPHAKAVPGALIITATTEGHEPFVARGAEVLVLAAPIGLPAVLDELGRHHITSVLVEGGGIVHGALVRERLVDEVALFVAPLFIGGDGIPLLASPGAEHMADALRLHDVRHRRLGDDVLVTGRCGIGPPCSPGSSKK